MIGDSSSAKFDPALIEEAADVLRRARGLLIAAGAGMGVDSGLPDFRGPEGFWRAYPPYRRLGLEFAAVANPRWFREDPGLAWGFYGHRLERYRKTAPHAGFQILARWAERMPAGVFVFTSNVDGHFARAGFPEEKICEVHGSIHHAQCLDGCGAGIFLADRIAVSVSPETFRWTGDFPKCPECGGMARPNILMFGDGRWDAARSEEQEDRLREWLRVSPLPLAIVEIGAGTGVPTVRMFSERLVRTFDDARLIRINLREPSVPSGEIALPYGGLEGLRAIDAALGAPES